MKAAQISEYGDPSVVKINEVEKPTLGEGQILVEVHASSLNPWDSKLRSGVVKDSMPLELPVTLGGDIAGVVAGVGSGVSEFVVGDKVYGSAGVTGGSGAFAEFASANTSSLAKMPQNVNF